MKIIHVKENTLGEMIGLKAGDRLLKINGKRVIDEIDYRFRITDESITLDLEIDGKMDKVSIDKDYDDDLGVEFEEFKIRKCGNDCVFCFVDQNPEGMRSGMYFRDGDYRLSYLHGHYITMTNMGQNELTRIVEQKMSPLYISVHTTDVELRQKLLLYGKEDFLMDKIDYLTENGIQLHTQVVLIPGLNDGKYLIKTLKDMYSYYPKVNSISIVPVGLTKHRVGLPELSTVTTEYAEKLVDYAESLKAQFPGSDEQPFIFLSDEWYIVAKKPFRPIVEMGGLNLIENGVGQVQSFLEDFELESKSFPTSFSEPTSFTIATGHLAYGIFETNVIPVLNSIENLHVNLVEIKNDFYGDMVTVAGLLAGQDIVNQLKDKDIGEAVWCSHRILNDEGTVTLDDMTLADLSSQLGVPVNVSHDSILEIFNRNIHG
jgi:putative radical SAM enzyme (TIGR03279 family)